MLTFVPAELYISKQTNFDDLPEEAQHQVGLPGHEIMGVDAHHRAADGRSRVQSQHQVLLQRANKPVCQKRVHDASETAAVRGVNVGHKVFHLLLSCYVSRKGNTCQVEAKMLSMRLKLIFNSIFVRSQHFFSSR